MYCKGETSALNKSNGIKTDRQVRKYLNRNDINTIILLKFCISWKLAY